MSKSSIKLKQEAFDKSNSDRIQNHYENIGIDFFAKGQVINLFLQKVKKLNEDGVLSEDEILSILESIGVPESKRNMGFLYNSIVEFEDINQYKESLKNYHKDKNSKLSKKCEDLYYLSDYFSKIYFKDGMVDKNEIKMDAGIFLDNLNIKMENVLSDNEEALDVLLDGIEDDINKGRVMVSVYLNSNKEPFLVPIYDGDSKIKSLEIKDLFLLKDDFQSVNVGVLESKDFISGLYDPFYTLNSKSPLIRKDKNNSVYGTGHNVNKMEGNLTAVELEENKNQIFSELMIDNPENINKLLSSLNSSLVNIDTIERLINYLEFDSRDIVKDKFIKNFYQNLESFYNNLTKEIFEITGNELPKSKNKILSLRSFFDILKKNKRLLEDISDVKKGLNNFSGEYKKDEQVEIKESIQLLVNRLNKLNEDNPHIENLNDYLSRDITKETVVEINNLISEHFDLDQKIGDFGDKIESSNKKMINDFKSSDYQLGIKISNDINEADLDVGNLDNELLWIVLDQEMKLAKTAFVYGEPGTGKTENLMKIFTFLGNASLTEAQGDADTALYKLFVAGGQTIDESKFQTMFSFITQTILKAKQNNRVLIDELIPIIEKAKEEYGFTLNEIMNYLYAISKRSATVKITNPTNIENQEQQVSLFSILSSVIFTGNVGLSDLTPQEKDRIQPYVYTKKEEFTNKKAVNSTLNNLIVKETLGNIKSKTTGIETFHKMFKTVLSNPESKDEMFPALASLKEKMDDSKFKILQDLVVGYLRECNLSNKNGINLTNNFYNEISEVGIKNPKDVKEIFNEILNLNRMEETIDLYERREDFRKQSPERLTEFYKVQNLSTLLDFLEIKGENRDKFLLNNSILTKGYNFGDLGSASEFVLDELKKNPKLNLEKFHLDLNDYNDVNKGKISSMISSKFFKMDFNIYSIVESLKSENINNARTTLLGNPDLRTRTIKSAFQGYFNYSNEIIKNKNGFTKLNPLLEQIKLDAVFLSIPQDYLKSYLQDIQIEIEKGGIEKLDQIDGSKFSNLTKDILKRSQSSQTNTKPDIDIEESTTDNYRKIKKDGIEVSHYLPTAYPYDGKYGNINNKIYTSQTLTNYLTDTIVGLNDTIYPETAEYENVKAITYRSMIDILGVLSKEVNLGNGFSFTNIVDDFIEEPDTEQYSIVESITDSYMEKLSTIITRVKPNETMSMGM